MAASQFATPRGHTHSKMHTHTHTHTDSGRHTCNSHKSHTCTRSNCAAIFRTGYKRCKKKTKNDHFLGPWAGILARTHCQFSPVSAKKAFGGRPFICFSCWLDLICIYHCLSGQFFTLFLSPSFACSTLRVLETLFTARQELCFYSQRAISVWRSFANNAPTMQQHHGSDVPHLY